jgi:CheY-like chemotaxis protein
MSSDCIHVLLVEDNEGDIVLTREAFEDSGVNTVISVVRDGEKAIRFLEKEKEYADQPALDLVLLDINLPKKNGHEVLNEIKTNENLRHIPVIMWSTSLSNEDVKRSYRYYANCYITKPDNIDSFYKAVRTIEQFWLKLAELPSG